MSLKVDTRSRKAVLYRDSHLLANESNSVCESRCWRKETTDSGAVTAFIDDKMNSDLPDITKHGTTWTYNGCYHPRRYVISIRHITLYSLTNGDI